jgi:nickel/cobalt transporter (NicO) family protein
MRESLRSSWFSLIRPANAGHLLPGEKEGALALLTLLLALLTLPAFAQSPSPFSLGGLEGAGGAPSSGISGWILAKQAEFSRAMTAAARTVRTDASALVTLLGLAFAYGVFHAAGPGHGKAIVASYIVANEAALKRGAAIATAAAILQGIVAVALVLAIAIVLGATRRQLTSAVNTIELASYAAIALFGAWLLFRKARGLLALWRGDPGEACNHFHMPQPGATARWSLRDAAAATVAAGIRPCTGAILILVFTLSQGILWAGIAAVAAMAAGVAVTTSGIAAVAVYFKAFAVRMAAGDGRSVWVVALLETLAAVAVLALGLTLLFGLWANIGGA